MFTLKKLAPQFKKWFVTFIIFTCSTHPMSAFSAEGTAGSVIINPQSLKTFVLSKNIPLMIQLNQVEQAKTKVNIARGNLLPSINLGAVISSGPTFGLTTISMLMPFLFPSNWMDLKQSYYLLNSQTKAYYIAKLNTFASAYATYLTVVSDLSLHDVLQGQLENYQRIEEFIRLGVEAGLRAPSDLMFAHAQTSMAFHQLSQIDELLKQEVSLLREMLSLPLSQELIIERTHPVKSSSEYLNAQEALKLSLSRAPELVQLDFLERAAKAAKWSQAFAFLNTGTLTETRTSATGAWSSSQVTGRVSIGFSYFPNLQLSSLNIEQIQLQKKQMALHQAQIVESVFGSLFEAHKQVEKATEAAASWTQYYDSELLKFRGGLTDLLHVLNAGNNLTTALIGKIKSQNDLDNQRVTLSRLLINQEFGEVQPCNAILNSNKGFTGTKFKTSDKDVSVEKFCDNHKSNP